MTLPRDKFIDFTPAELATRLARPLVSTAGLGHNAFKLYARAQRVLIEAGATDAELDEFAADAQADILVAMPTHAYPRTMYKHVLVAVSRRCRVVAEAVAKTGIKRRGADVADVDGGGDETKGGQ